MALSTDGESSAVPIPISQRRTLRPSFSDVLGAYALTYVDFDSLLQADEQADEEAGEENGEDSAPENRVVARALVPNGLVGRAWSSLGALVHVGGR